MSKVSLNLQARPCSVCILPLRRVNPDVGEMPSRVSRALGHTKDKKGYIFTRLSQDTLSVQNLRLSRTESPFWSYRLSTSSQEPNRLTPEAVSRENDCKKSPMKRILGSPSMSTLRSSGTIESQSESISLVPGVFQSKKPKPRIILRYRQLSAEERVIQWLYRSCTHPARTLPLLWYFILFYFSFNFAIEVFYMFNIKGFGLKKLPQRKGGDGKGQGLRSPMTDVWSPGKCPVR